MKQVILNLLSVLKMDLVECIMLINTASECRPNKKTVKVNQNTLYSDGNYVFNETQLNCDSLK
jgi:hypothetical protein